MENQEPPVSGKKGSIAKRFNIILLVMYLVMIVIAALASYLASKSEVEANAQRELRLLGDVVASIRGYVSTDLRPWFQKNNQFHTSGISGIVAVSKVAENLQKRQVAYAIRNVSDNPLNPDNSPEPFEQELLKRLRADPTQPRIQDIGAIRGKRMMVTVSPIVNDKPDCVTCHGAPEAMPKEVTERYGKKTGYNYQSNQIVGLELVGVPVDDVNALALKRTLYAVLAMSVLFALLFMAINMAVRRNIIVPIQEVTATAKAVVKGNLEQTITVQRNDEIGELARAVELLRRSFTQMMKRMR